MPQSATAHTPNPDDRSALRRVHCRRDLRRNIRNSIAEGSAFNLMVGLGETYFPAFVLALGLGEVPAGLISTLPLLAGAILQLAAPYLIARFRSYRRWVLVCASMQGLAFVPLIVAAITGHLSLQAVFLIAAVYWGFGMAGGPAWNTWMGTLVPSRMQTGFFTQRSFWTQVTALIGFLVGGLALRAWPKSWPAIGVFAMLFSAALICRCLSIYWLHGQSEPVPPPANAVPAYMPWQLVGRLRKDPALAKLLSYLLLVQLGTQFASPFFTPYMLGELHFSYSAYALLVVASYLTKIVMLPKLGRLALGQGTRTLLWVGGMGIVSLPALWLISSNFVYLICLQVISGLFWGAYDLAALLLLFECICPEERTALLSGYNFVNALVVVAGSLTGGAVLHHFGCNRDAYVLVFCISALARGLTLLGLRRVSHQKTDWLPTVLRPLAFRPSFGFAGLPLGLTGRGLWRRPTTPSAEMRAEELAQSAPQP